MLLQGWTMTNTMYANASSNIQTTVRDILKADTNTFYIKDRDTNTYTSSVTLASMNIKIIDGTPSFDTLAKASFPLILVHSALIDEKRLTNTKFKFESRCKIEIMTTEEGNCRRIYDAVRNALKSANSTSLIVKLWWREIVNPNLENFIGPNNKAIYTITTDVKYNSVVS
jgi:hypothetical protein